ncbi:unnamed protein product [Didymodactylos carnosus]|uniref:Uncharacterized protein n=1 Tax=Didymodactylos carnosus TaxID=1234261 RepID=A0A8S2FWV5_9BILA|nr:unnamed protein product [Didymodactylos carnosus]CAF4378059.1 unnamed protein product [Didymodactylos carnosus]
MSEHLLISRNSDGDKREKLRSILEKQFTKITKLLYTTSVPSDVLDNEVLPYIANDVVFTDPWQNGGSKELYRIGMKGFHCMFNFTMDIFQLNVKLNDDDTGRVIVDGIMNLEQFKWIYTYPLRTILVYDFRLLNKDVYEDEQDDDLIISPLFEIYRHEEMWSFGDMIANLPVAGWFYRNIFRVGFGYAFVFASGVSCYLKDVHIEHEGINKFHISKQILHKLALFRHPNVSIVMDIIQDVLVMQYAV